jgi:glycerophosphoryl diester phosphodiesterase
MIRTKVSALSARPFQRKEGRRPFVLGHRGARALCPENTMLAFQRALDDGADGVELDVRMSADCELFISHDDTLKTESGGVSLKSLSAAQVHALRMQSGEPVPTLREVLHFQARTGAYLNVELKGDVPSPQWMARRAAAEIGQHGGQGIVLSSFNPRQVFLLAQLLPEVPAALLFEHKQRLLPRLLPLGILGASAAHPEACLIDSALMTRLRAKVPLINVWTVNEVAEARRLSELGVDGIITDNPRLILGAFS